METNNPPYTRPRAWPGWVGIIGIPFLWLAACAFLPWVFFGISFSELIAFFRQSYASDVPIDPRHVFFGISGATAIVSLGVLAWRGGVLVKQIERQISQQRIDTLSRGIEQIGHSWSNTVRVAGVKLLRRLIEDDPRNIGLRIDIIGIVRDHIREAPASGRADPQSKLNAIEFLKEIDLARPLDLSGAQLRGVHLQNIDLQGINLENANFTGAHLEKSDLREAILKGANLTFTKFEETNLSKTILVKTDLYKANLNGVNLSKAILTNSKLGGVIFRKTNLSESNLENTKFWITDDQSALEGADFQSANLNGAKYYPSPATLNAERTTRASLLGRLVTKTWLRDHGVKNWETADAMWQ